MFIFFISIFVSTTVLADGDDCSTIKDVAPHLGPAHNQQSLGWCYAFTAADLISQKMQKDGTLKSGERIHPLQVAADYHLSGNRDPSSSQNLSGVPGDVFIEINKNREKNVKLCKESDLGPETGPDAPLFKQSESNATAYFRTALEKDDRQNPCLATDQNLRKLSDTMNQMKKISAQTWAQALNAKCSVPAPPLDWYYNYDRKRGQELSGKDPVPANNESAKSMKTTVDYALEHGSMAAIAYIPNFLQKNPGSNKDFHWSSIVGRQKTSNGQCYYQIRNSWGADCSTYKDPKNCHSGYIWVNSNELMQNTSTVQYIK